jgi:hydrogenase maturation protease
MEIAPENEDRVLVIGFGDHNRGDAAIGTRVVSELCLSYQLPDEVEVVAVVGPGLDLLDVLEGASRVVAVDAVLGDGEPGVVYRLSLDEYERDAEIPEALHEGQLLEALGVMEVLGRRPTSVLLGVQVADVLPGRELTAQLRAKLGEVVGALATELASLGLAIAPLAAERGC